MEDKVVYIDVMLLTNFVISYVILLCVKKTGNFHSPPMRLIIGSLLGALYSTVIYFPSLSLLQTAASQVVLSSAICAITFKLKNFKEFLKGMVYIYIISFLLAGCIMFISYTTGEVMVRNGAIYFSNSFKTIGLALIAAFFGINYFLKYVTKMYSRKNIMYKIKIAAFGKEVVIDGMVDTGNLLRDPISKLPVIIVDLHKLDNFLPDEMKKCFLKEDNIDEEFTNHKLRILPCKTVNNEGVMLGFKPDFIEVSDNKKTKTMKDVIIGVSTNSLTFDESFTALINPEII